MMITLSEETVKELLDRSWLCDVYGRRMAEIKKLCNDETPTVEAWTKIIEIVK